MSDPRPRPEYGEYATPDEQVAAGGTAIDPPEAPTGENPPETRSAAFPPPTTSPIPGPAPRVAPQWDVTLTMALLFFGAFSIVSSAPGYIDFSDTLTSAAAIMDIGKPTNAGLANAFGVVALAVQIAVYTAVLVITLRRLRSKRLTFFVPLAGGVAAAVLLSVIMGVLIAVDPGLAGALAAQR